MIVTLMISLAVLYVFRRFSSRRIFTAVVLALTLIQAALFMYRQVTADNKHVNAGNVYPIVTSLMDSDIMYLPQGMDSEILKDRTIRTSSDEITVQDMGFDGKEYTIGVNNVSSEEGRISLPLIYYPGYTASGGLSVTAGEDHRVELTVPAGYGSMVTVGFVMILVLAAGFIYFAKRDGKEGYERE